MDERISLHGTLMDPAGLLSNFAQVCTNFVQIKKIALVHENKSLIYCGECNEKL